MIVLTLLDVILERKIKLQPKEFCRERIRKTWQYIGCSINLRKIKSISVSGMRHWANGGGDGDGEIRRNSCFEKDPENEKGELLKFWHIKFQVTVGKLKEKYLVGNWT